MPRSGPGPVTGTPSRRTRPSVGVSSPATIRSSVDFPQPEGPRMVMKSLSATARRVGSSARVGGRPRRPGKVRATPSIRSFGKGSLGYRKYQGNRRSLAALKRTSEMSPMMPITTMPKIICPVSRRRWESMIMCPIPEEAPMSSATMT